MSGERAIESFGERLRLRRESLGLTQEELAERVNLDGRAMIYKYESGTAAPDAARAVELARALEDDPGIFMLLAALQRCVRDKTETRLLRRTVKELLRQRRQETLPSLALESHLSLLDFPRSFEPLAILVGDRREEKPESPGDLFVFPASTMDDRWLARLGLGRDTEKISDKVLFTADEDWLKRRFGSTNILCIGSPASNLFAREYNRNFLFRFATSREAVHLWRAERGKLRGRRAEAELLKHRKKPKDMKHLMRMFRQPGFVNFLYDQLTVGIDLSANRDFAVLSVGRNPWSSEADPYFAIIAAGVHHAGTAKALDFLAEPSNFRDHPFGGILEIEVPGDNINPKDVSWHEKIESSVASWHTVGSSNLQYTPRSLTEKLRRRWLPRVDEDELAKAFAITRDEIKDHISLIQRLAAAKASQGG